MQYPFAGTLLVGTCATLWIVDMVLDRYCGIRATESWFIRDTMCRHPHLVFALGVLAGHFLAGMKPE